MNDVFNILNLLSYSAIYVIKHGVCCQPFKTDCLHDAQIQVCCLEQLPAVFQYY